MDSTVDPANIGDILELQRLKALYFYHLDHNEWDEWASLFTEDVRLLVDRLVEGVPTTDVVEGIEEVLAYVAERITPVRSVHHGHTPIFEFESEIRARGIWAMSDVIEYDERTCMYGYGHYREQYSKENGTWRFRSVHLTRLRVEVRRAGS